MKRTKIELSMREQRAEALVLADHKKRRLMAWSAPVIVSVILPSHAQATELPPPPPPRASCPADPVIEASPPKCSSTTGSSDIAGQATVVVKSNSDSIEILSISHNGGSEILLPTLPAMVTSSAGIDIKWAGPASDGLTCLPITQITLTVSFTCNGADSASKDFNLTELLAAVIL